MQPTNIKTPKQALNPAFLKQRPEREKIELFKKEFIALLENINEKESEEFHKNLVSQFLNAVYYKDNHFINTKGYADLVIHNGKNAKSPVAVLIEAKSPTNKTEMVSEKNLNVKSFQELVLYYLRERKTGKNFELRHLVVTNVYEWFVFDAQEFEKLFYQDKRLLKKFEEFEAGKLSGTSTDFFYKEIATPAIEEVKQQIVYTHFDIRKYDKILRDDNRDNDKGLIALYKFLSPIHLLKLSFANDYNQLNKEFYTELLHIMGLEEIKEKSQKFIVRKSKGNRDNGSIIENTIYKLDAIIDYSRIPNIAQYGKTSDERLFNIALDLCITWINRVLFLKLLEAQIVKYNNNDKEFLFLSTDKLSGYDDLDNLFFQILARKEEERRDGNLKDKFSHVPYLNSSLFEPTELERNTTLYISALPDNASIDLYSKYILKSKGRTLNKDNEIKPLEYLLRFLDAYDFSSEGAEEIQEENKPLISASVLGLIFEKINGYKDGSFFTPSYITMFMCRDTITRTVIQKFNDIKGWECQTTNDLYNKITDIKEANEIYNSVRICDPAVGSGHFLVSSLNELIYLKSELGILVDKEGKKLKDYRLSIENDELIVSDSESGIFKYEPHKHESQRIQETLFHEKQTIIENCLFGVDLNPNSVKICQLRLWIELLKHTYYKSNSKNLETLPNIDINIKCGNSLISRFGLDEDLKPALRKLGYTIANYQHAVDSYRNAHNKEEKRELNELIQTIKSGLKTEIAIKDPLIVKLSKKRGQLQSLDQLGLFEEKVSKSKKQSIEKLKKEIQQISTQIEEIKNNVIYQNALEWRLEFPEVLDGDGNFIGFDAIVGNPPYIRIQGIKESDSQLADAYKDIYTSATGSYDIYSLFVEKTLSLIKANGIINFIMPTKWTNASFGKGLRTIITQNKSISKMINFGSFQVFDASTYTGLQWFEKNSNYLQYLELEEDSVQSDNELYCFLKNIETSHFNKISSNSLTPEPWILSHGHIMKIIDKLNEQPRRLSDIFDRIFTGLQTSRDDVYFLNECIEKENLVEGYSKDLSKRILIEKNLVKPLLKGEDVHRYQKITTNRVVVFPYKIINNEATLYTEEELSAQFPLGYSYLKECEEILRGREKGRFNIDGEWFQFGRKQGINFAEFEKLVAPEISKGGNFAYDKKGEFYSTTKNYGYILNGEVDESYLFWLGLLNSQLFWFFIKNTGYVLRGGYYTFKTNYITPFPIPASIPFPISKQIENLVSQILSIKEVAPKSCTMEQEKMIDILIYELYNLTTDDIKVIEYTE